VRHLATHIHLQDRIAQVLHLSLLVLLLIFLLLAVSTHLAVLVLVVVHLVGGGCAVVLVVTLALLWGRGWGAALLLIRLPFLPFLALLWLIQPFLLPALLICQLCSCPKP
jgi:hypothetical protein